MRVEAGDACPFLGGKPCMGLKCKMMTLLRGTHPQTGEPIDEWDCAVKWLPVLMIEGAREARETAAAVESLRNEIVEATTAKRIEHMITNQNAGLQPKVLEHAPQAKPERTEGRGS